VVAVSILTLFLGVAYKTKILHLGAASMPARVRETLKLMLLLRAHLEVNIN
jgi:hypothetical protein